MDARCGKQPRGRFMPHIDRNRCEGKGDCIAVCPFNVFSIGKLAAADRQAQGHGAWLGTGLHAERRRLRGLRPLRQRLPREGHHPRQSPRAKSLATCTDCC
jgi:NAD-dependent dihydropyrimidine dehydrogenase PreA subunit